MMSIHNDNLSQYKLSDKARLNGDKYVPVHVEIHIRFNKTLEIVTFDDKALFDKEEQSLFLFGWEEGNYSCSCNRSLFFSRAKGEEDWIHDCGEGDFSVNIFNPQTGNCVYSEFEEVKQKSEAKE